MGQSKTSFIGRSHRRYRRSRLESLENRELLAGLVLEQSVFDVEQFASNIEEQIPVEPFGSDGVVGYSYAIIDGDPANPISNGLGFARMPWDGPENPQGLKVPLLADPQSPQEIASISKAITGSAIMHLLQNQTSSVEELEFQINLPAATYLPGFWGISSWFNTITIKELLTHSSGLRAESFNGGSAYSYGSLRNVAENLVTPFQPVPAPPVDYPGFFKVADYYTGNFPFFRVMLPYLWDEISNQHLDNSTAIDPNYDEPVVDMSDLVPSNGQLRDALETAFQQDWGVEPLEASPSPYSDRYALSPGQVTASIYKYYVSEYILKPSGVANPQSETTGEFPTLLYPLNPTIVPGSDVWPIVPGAPPTPAQVPGLDTDDQTLNLGPRGWNLSAEDVALFFTGMRHGATNGATILSDETLALMDGDGLGWQHSTNPGYVGDFGQYYGHNGINFRPAPPNWPLNPLPGDARLGSMNNTVGIAFPNDVEAAILINSQIQSADDPDSFASPVVVGQAFNSDSTPSAPSGTGMTGVLRNAYDNAWPELVYNGDSPVDFTADEDDVFMIALNPVSAANPNAPQYIDFFHDTMSTQVFTRRVDTLKKFTINGNGGNDTYLIRSLPQELELVINGGNLNDTVIVGGQAGAFNLPANTPGSLTFHGGTGTNTLTIDDTDNLNFAPTYTLKHDEFTRTGAGPYSFYDVDAFILNANNQKNWINVESHANSTVSTINAQNGNDTVTIGGGTTDSVFGTIDVVGGTGGDTIRFWDLIGNTPHNYTIASNAFTLGSQAVVGYSENDKLELRAGNSDDSVTVESLAANQVLDLFLGVGDDDVTLDLVSDPLTTSLLGTVFVDGGGGGGGAGDTLTVNDSTSLNGTEYTITGASVQRPGIQPIEYEDIENLNVHGAVPASDYKIRSTSAATTVTGGVLGDFFDVGLLRLDFLDGPLTINGGDNFNGEDTVELDDFAGTSPTYGLVNNALFGASFATIQLNEVEQATLDGNGLGNGILIENAPGPTRYIVNGGGGDDMFSVAEGSRDLSTVNTPLILNGGLDDDSLLLDDRSSPNPLNYTVTENSIDRLLFGEQSLVNENVGVTFSSMVDVELQMNAVATQTHVQSTIPATRYLFYGNGGADTLNLNRHLDDEEDPFVDIDGVSITSASMDVEYDDFDQLNLKLGSEQNTVRIHELDSSAAVHLGPGDDRLLVTPASGELGDIDHAISVVGEGGIDRLQLHDFNHAADAQYTVAKSWVDRAFFGPILTGDPGITYADVDIVRLFMGAGASVVDVVSTAPDTEYLLDGAGGDDTFRVHALPSSPLTLFGSIGNDHAEIIGTDADEELSVSVGFGTSDINMPGIETASYDGFGGIDVLVAEGVAGVSEQIEVEASTTAAAGTLRITSSTIRGSSLLELDFERTEIVDLLASPKAADGTSDTAVFVGTGQADRLEINLGAAGSDSDPVLELFATGVAAPLLTLRDYRNFGVLRVEGRDGADEINVYVAPTGPGTGHRDLLVDGGSPSVPGGNKDKLTVFYEGPMPPPGPPPQNPVEHDTMLDQFFADYDPLHQFTIDYLDVEVAKKQNANAGS